MGGKSSPERRAWTGMKHRCLNKNHRAFPSYGGRGISICQRWLDSFDNFLADMGPRPSPGHSIDRIDNDGNYEPGNCRWATESQQHRNTRLVKCFLFNGEKLSVPDIAERIGISADALNKRLRRGMTIEQAVSKFSPNGRTRHDLSPAFSAEEAAALRERYAGGDVRICDLAREHGVTSSTIQYVLSNKSYPKKRKKENPCSA